MLPLMVVYTIIVLRLSEAAGELGSYIVIDVVVVVVGIDLV